MPHGDSWTPEDDAHLLELVSAGARTPKIAATLGRTQAAVFSRRRTISRLATGGERDTLKR